MPEYTPLPDEVVEICRFVHASPRLIAHLTLVHDVAKQLVHEIRHAFPQLDFDSDLVLFGAATHDIGKSVHPTELAGPGSKHEHDGLLLLRNLGIPENRARFAHTHGAWMSDATLQLEDLLVALADNCWKGKRPAPLEEEIVRVISSQTQEEQWEVFTKLDEILQRLAGNADERLAWQAQFAISGA